MSSVGQTPVQRPASKNVAFGAIVARLRLFVADTPGRMRALRLLGVAASLIFAFGASGAAWAQRDALRDLRKNAEQQTRLGVIRTSIVEADAVATNSFLTDGLEAAGTRVTYEAAMKRGSLAIADAASADAADRSLLGDVNAELVRYSGLIESARATNRQGLPVGVAYVKQASAIARDAILPKLTMVSRRHASNVDAQLRRLSGIVMALRVTTLFGIAVLIGILAWLAVRTRRTLNVAYSVAVSVMVLSAALAATSIRHAQTNVAATYRGDYAETLTLLQARANAFEARSAESLTLISRGSGSAFDERYVELKSDALVQLDSNLTSSFTGTDSGGGARAKRGPENVDRNAARKAFRDYDAIHTKVRSLDNQGNWDGAVDIVTATGDRSAAQVFATFAAANQRSIDRAATAVANEVASQANLVNYSGWMLLASGLLAALLSLLGMSARLREYS